MPDSSEMATGPTDNIAAIILAAGKSTRMKSKLPKPLHPVCGIPMTTHVIEACRHAGFTRCVVVIGHEAETVKSGLEDGYRVSGTGSRIDPAPAPAHAPDSD